MIFFDETVRDIVRKMAKYHIGSIVVAQEDRPVGIITERDVLVQLAQARLDLDTARAKDMMSKPVLTTGVRQTIREAADFMTHKNIKSFQSQKKRS
jgi:CBS domain-containing protein